MGLRLRLIIPLKFSEQLHFFAVHSSESPRSKRSSMQACVLHRAFVLSVGERSDANTPRVYFPTSLSGGDAKISNPNNVPRRARLCVRMCKAASAQR
jgi:hypothetical protein